MLQLTFWQFFNYLFFHTARMAGWGPWYRFCPIGVKHQEKIAMKPIEIPRELLMQADFLNTVGGGVSMPLVEASRTEEGYIARIAAPGVSVENMKVDLVNSRLVVYYKVPLSESFGEEHVFPYFLVNFPIASDVDYHNITARYEDRRLIVFGPFNDLAKGLQRNIDIES
jgi:HSP20 family molecular chaperone IbpA